jgi:isocitrate/isopropylmalate dehydrogenase
MKAHRIAAMPGDGIGPEVMAVALAALRAVAGGELRLEIEC